MKRISILAAVIVMAAGSVSEGHFGYGFFFDDAFNYQVHWSIYTQSLVPGDVYYSPYAYNYGRSGLVPYWIRYSPYAFSYDHPSGLVNDYATSPSSTKYIYYSPGYGSYTCPGWPVDYSFAPAERSQNVSPAESASARYAKKVEARRQRIRQLTAARMQAKANGPGDRSRVIASYLSSRNIEFKTDRLLQIEGKTISADFLLPGSNTLIKYWDPVAIAALDQQPKYRRRAYENYLESWKGYCRAYQRAGGRVYQIASADSDEILAKLEGCSALNTHEQIYAAAQSNSPAVEKP
jgi:hypothetical protein